MLHPESLGLLASKHELARAYTENDQPEKAIKLLEEVMQIKERILAPTHPERLTSQYELARAYYRSGQYQQALPIIWEVVQIQRETLRPDYPDQVLSEELFVYVVSEIEREREKNERRKKRAKES